MVAAVRVGNGNVGLHVAEDGDPTAPPILLLHGIIGSVATWNWIVPDLAERFRVLRLDFRGHGGSDRAPGAYTTQGYVSDAIAALEQAAGRPCVVIGHSLGGATAAAITQRRPDLLTAAVLEDPPLGPATASEPSSLEGHALMDGFKLLREAIPQAQQSEITLDALMALISEAPSPSGGATFGDVLLPDGVESMARSMLDVDATVLDPVIAGTSGPFLDPAAPLGVPTLLVAADPAKPDAVATVEVAEHYAAISRDVELVVMDGAGHQIHNERATRERFRTVVLGFLDRLATSH
jgi:pimeloyl-ACP methyl ester carboxylesterase